MQPYLNQKQALLVPYVCLWQPVRPGIKIGSLCLLLHITHLAKCTSIPSLPLPLPSSLTSLPRSSRLGACLSAIVSLRIVLSSALRCSNIHILPYPQYWGWGCWAIMYLQNFDHRPWQVWHSSIDNTGNSWQFHVCTIFQHACNDRSSWLCIFKIVFIADIYPITILLFAPFAPKGN